MKVEIAIYSVDGESVFQIQTLGVSNARAFLQAYDHEGSTVAVTLTLHDEEAYKALERLTDTSPATPKP